MAVTEICFENRPAMVALVDRMSNLLSASNVFFLRCAVIQAQQSEVAGVHTERMSLTLPYLAAARQRILLITGTEKF